MERFAVVADEVRKLADERNAVNGISELISNIQTEVDRRPTNTGQVEAVNKEVEKGEPNEIMENMANTIYQVLMR